MQAARCALAFARLKVGNNSEASVAMTAITTSSSTRVNPAAAFELSLMLL